MIRYIINYPPNTKRANAFFGKFTIVVACPHCKTIHHHAKTDRYKNRCKALCGLGYYVIDTDEGEE